MLIDELVRGSGMALLLISHDLGVMARHVQRVMVMYGGTVVESGPTGAVFARRAHPYTRGLYAARPRLGATRGTRLPTIPGRVPELADLPHGLPVRGPLRARDRRLPARAAAGGRGRRRPRGALHPHRGGRAMSHADSAARRNDMVATQIEARGVRDPRVLAAMRAVPREDFVAARLARPRLRRQPLADRSRPDDLAALHRGASWPRRCSCRAASACSRSAPARATPRRCSGDWRRRCTASSASPNSPTRRPRHLPRWALHERAPCTAATARSAGPRRRPTTRSSSRRPGPQVPAALKAQLAVGGRLVMPVGDAIGDQRTGARHAQRRTTTNVGDAAGRSLRAADRRAGLAG